MESQRNMPALRSLFQLEEEACCHLVCWNSKSTDAHLATSLDNEHASHREHTRPKDQFDSSVWSEKDFSWFRLLKVRPLGTVLLR